MLVHLRFPAGIRVRFKAGQHLNLILDNGERRDFSMANPPRESDGAQLHIRHVPGGAFTTYVFEKLKRGDSSEARNAVRRFHACATATSRSCSSQARPDLRRSSRSSRTCSIKGIGRDMTLYWGARQRSGLYSDLPHKWASAEPALQIRAGDFRRAEPGIRHNLVHKAVLEDHPSLAGFPGLCLRRAGDDRRPPKPNSSPPGCPTASSSPTRSSPAPRSRPVCA